MALVALLAAILVGVTMTSHWLLDIDLTPDLVPFFVGLYWSLRLLDAVFTGDTDKLCSDWYSLADSASRYTGFCFLLRPGDIVEIKTVDSTEHAICVENEEEARLVLPRKAAWELGFCADQPDGGSSQYCTVGLPKLYELDKKASHRLHADFTIRINNSRDKVSDPKPVNDILSYALAAVTGIAQQVHGQRDYWVSDSKFFVERARYPLEALDNRLSPDRGRWLGWWFGPPHCSPWFRDRDLETLRWLLRVGDLVEFDRWLYSHWAVNQDWDAQVLLHRSGCNVAQKGPIRLAPISTIIKGSRFRINNSLDTMYQPMVDRDVYMYSLNVINSKSFGVYNLLLNNCKRFAENFRYRNQFRKNLGFSSFFYSRNELRHWLFEGDIIRFCGDFKTEGYAIYLGKQLDETGPDKVVYGYIVGRVPVARAEPLEDFFNRLKRIRWFEIRNELDNKHTPLELEVIVEAASTAVDRTGPHNTCPFQSCSCSCCPFKNGSSCSCTPFTKDICCCPFNKSSLQYVRQLRNGSEQHRAVESFPPATSCNILWSVYGLWHRFVCKDCHPRWWVF